MRTWPFPIILRQFASYRLLVSGCSDMLLMTQRSKFVILICLCATIGLTACRDRSFHTLPGGNASVGVGSYFDHGRWTVMVKNRCGSVSDTMFAVGDNPRSNIYETPSNQIVVIGKGGEAVFFHVTGVSAPVLLDGNLSRLRDQNSDTWHYVGVIENGNMTHRPECIALMGEGGSPYRKQFQRQHC